jgi:hypothetical protein
MCPNVGSSYDLAPTALDILLLETLFSSSESEEGILLCGVGVQSYSSNQRIIESNGGTAKTVVSAMLSDGSALDACALLACDGRVRG